MSGSLASSLSDPARPSFLFGSSPPREGTSEEDARAACEKFVSRSRALACDGFIVYDLQDEAGRTKEVRPFPFRKTLDPSWYGSLFRPLCGKETVIYKCVAGQSPAEFEAWLDTAITRHGHTAFNLVGAASSSADLSGSVSLGDAARGVCSRANLDAEKVGFGCVTIAERHAKKGNEHENILRKTRMGAEWFISQGVFDAEATIKMLMDYADLCRSKMTTPKKVVLTFAPCGRRKTMTFIKWLGMDVPKSVEERIFSKNLVLPDGRDHGPVNESCDIACEILTEILQRTAACGVPLGVNVESLSIFREEIDAAHLLFQRLQTIILNARGSPWAVRWFDVTRVGRPSSMATSASVADLYAQERLRNQRRSIERERDGFKDAPALAPSDVTVAIPGLVSVSVNPYAAMLLAAGVAGSMGIAYGRVMGSHNPR